MTHTYFFQYNVPADNARTGTTDCFVNVFSEWNGTSFFSDGRPMITSKMPIIQHLYDMLLVKDWQKAIFEIEHILDEHFAAIAERVKIEQAKEVLSNAKVIGDFTIAPTLERMTETQYSSDFWNSKPPMPGTFDETYRSQLTDLS